MSSFCVIVILAIVTGKAVEPQPSVSNLAATQWNVQRRADAGATNSFIVVLRGLPVGGHVDCLGVLYKGVVIITAKECFRWTKNRPKYEIQTCIGNHCIMLSIPDSNRSLVFYGSSSSYYDNIAIITLRCDDDYGFASSSIIPEDIDYSELDAYVYNDPRIYYSQKDSM